MHYITEEEAQEAGISIQEQALKRTEVKRELRKAGIAYDNEQRFEELEAMLEEHEDKIERVKA